MGCPGTLMILPAGVNKATGLAAAQRRLGLSPEQIVGIGDAENDVRLVEACGLGVAVANAAPRLKLHSDAETEHGTGRGVSELIDRICGADRERTISLPSFRLPKARGLRP